MLRVVPLLLLLLTAPAAAGEPAWRYQVVVGDGARELAVSATLAPGYSEELSVDDGAESFVRDVAVDDGGGWRPLSPRGTSWRAPGCARRGCRLRYRFELARAAARLDSETAGRLAATTLQAPPATWLLRPLHPPSGRDYRFTVATPPELRFVSGVHRAADGSWGADVTTLSDAPYAAFGPLAVETVALAGTRIELAFVPAARALGPAQIAAAIGRAAGVVRAYLGRFPVEQLLVIVAPAGGNELHGSTMGGGGATLVLFVGDTVDAAALSRSWVPVHELLHLAFPTVPRDQLWIAEGLATYVEPIARARAGELSAEQVWRDLVDGLPQGLPERGDRGLDRTHTWGRIYWGGALYCLLADVEIRRRTANRRSLDDALRAIVDGGGSLAVAWPLERALAVGDVATGVPVLAELRRQLGAAPTPVDLEALWARLGVRRAGERIVFDDGAPLAAIRKAITAP